MKKQYLTFEFLFLAIFFFIPPLLKQPIQANFIPQNQFSLGLLYSLLISIILYIQMNCCKSKTKITHFFRNVLYSSYVLKTFGVLVVTAACINIINFLFFHASESLLSEQKLNFVVIIFTFLISSFYEEIIYRLYIPYFFDQFDFSKKTHLIFVEILPILIFAFSHRYIGWPAVINAFIAGITLRICYKKSGTIFTGFIAHFLYNTCMFTLQVIQQTN